MRVPLLWLVYRPQAPMPEMLLSRSLLLSERANRIPARVMLPLGLVMVAPSTVT